ncbi:PR5-like receptor kinase [Gossypium hirsutum]|uniref:PR5-like receptor kinase n=1 Tax=Gossypium hirsutum TaxID=3635 RepID=A0ABM3B5I2_GOSHI|nr:PR5-like receptor kinase [Gossypium hirsutum]
MKSSAPASASSDLALLLLSLSFMMLGVAVSQRNNTRGFSLNPGESTSISIPRSWTGRIWGRTLCTQDSSGNFSCLTGDCGTSRPECSGSSSIQATLAEFGFNDLGDFYDVSVVPIGSEACKLLY